MRSKQQSFQFNTSFAFPISALILIIVVLYAINHWPLFSTPSMTPSVASILPDPKKATPFTLIDADNQLFTQKNLDHHWTLLFFGFTRCHNLCPMALSLLNRLYNTLQPSYPFLQVAFISTDPDNDTPAVIKNFTASFNKNFIGATGTVTEIQALQKQFGIFSEKMVKQQNGVHFRVNHSNVILLVNPRGELQAYFPANSQPDEIRLAFEEIVKHYV